LTPDSSGQWRVAVVGGGVAGSLAAITLAGLPQVASIAVFDRDNAFGRGLAYSAKAPWHRINVPAYKMGGIAAEDTEGFVDWLAETGQAKWSDYSGSFVPRLAYGDYIAAQLSKTVARGHATMHADTITHIADQHVGYELTLASGDRQTFDLVLLCLGNPSPSPFPGIEASPRSITDVWAPGALDPISINDRVLVIGTGATAVDVVIDLYRRGMQQPIMMMSRRGLLPLIDAPAQIDPAPLETWPEPTTRGIFAALLENTRSKMAAGISWQTSIDTFRLQIARFWADASLAERERFSRHLRAVWLVHRHRLAPDVAQLLEQLQSEQRLDVIAGRILTAKITPTGYDVAIRRRGGTSEQITTDWILNCTGPEERYEHIENPLVKSMLADGIACAGNSGLGLDVDETCQIRDRSGQVQQGLYAIGHATRGAFWEVTAATNIRQQILDIAGLLSATPIR
jgi:uncharacterized NAD(P)/FAD-binding protein YdhS